VVSVRLFGWWNDETKGYRLEDLESGGGKVIASWNIKFMEDESPSELTVVDVCRMTATAEEINGLIDGAISSSMGKLTISSLGALSTPDMSKSVTLSPQVSSLPSILTSSITNERKLVYLTPTSLTPIDQNLMSDKVVPENVVKDIVSVTTVPCQTSTQIRKPIDCYGFTTVEELKLDRLLQPLLQQQVNLKIMLKSSDLLIEKSGKRQLQPSF